MCDDSASESNAGSEAHVGQPDRRQVLVTAMAATIMIGAPNDIAAQTGTASARPMASVPTRLIVNGTPHALTLDPRSSLLDVLREQLALTGAKKGCDHGQCGACTVHLDGVATRSCQVPVGSIGDAKITTIEGLSPDGLSHPVQVAWLQHDVPQCGYCQSGQIMAAAALLKTNPKPSDADIDDAMTNICRCGT
jgi:isoquinoline 1-oxidoreductase subunit alpha